MSTNVWTANLQNFRLIIEYRLDLILLTYFLRWGYNTPSIIRDSPSCVRPSVLLIRFNSYYSTYIYSYKGYCLFKNRVSLHFVIHSYREIYKTGNPARSKRVFLLTTACPTIRCCGNQYKYLQFLFVLLVLGFYIHTYIYKYSWLYELF